jgi:hypothetical protein
MFLDDAPAVADILAKLLKGPEVRPACTLQLLHTALVWHDHPLLS